MSENTTSDDEDDWGIYDDDDYDEECWRCQDGYIIVCVDDMCRGSGGCGKYSDPTCYETCPNGCY